MDESKKEKLRDLLQNGENWAKLEAFDGVYVVKMPKSGRFKAKLAIEINPVDEDGKPLKRKGIYITSIQQLDAFGQIFANSELKNVMDGLTEINENSPSDNSQGKVVGKL